MTFASLLLVSFTHVVLATQPVTPSEPPLAPTPGTPPPLVASPESCAPGTETRYAQGFDALIEGEDEAALRAFEQVQDVCPQHPFAAEMARLAQARLQPGAKLAGAAAASLSREAPSSGARAALTVVQSLHGITQGALLCSIADCNAQGVAGAVLAGGTAGAVSALLLSTGGVTPGQAAVVNSSTVWGFWLGVSLFNAMDLLDNEATAMTMASAAAFTGVGIGLAVGVSPSAGQVAMANSGGLWAAVLTALILETGTVDNSTFFAAELGATSAGLLSLAILSRMVEASRGRMLIIDGGGFLGGLTGAAFGLLIGGGQGDGDGVLISASVGVVVGLGLAVHLTRDFDAPGAPEVAFTPSLMGRDGAGFAMFGRF
ncbi:hypothetical protein LZ198_25185 [Myxococcus sp. K15C18031901]|uniref:hypothetical protein n=1 Tax=Myxococcus dinghuensis TaxID=2906761 RepID=UPI0020A79329|nr:hypothetical protein [Myxococcus dinghuensis]MCP3102167.1 hypothetical protein [Myxococcus dinghuensis]